MLWIGQPPRSMNEEGRSPGRTLRGLLMRIFLMGGTGLVGSRLVKRLLERQDQVVMLTRRPDAARQKWAQAVTVVEGDPVQAGDWARAVDDCDAVVNLTGE